MYIYYSILSFVLGTVIGSFLNVVIYRVPNDIKIGTDRSHCTTCGYTLQPKDLIPVLSYFSLKGKCRNCKEKISNRYWLVELFTGFMFLFIYLINGYNWMTLFWFLYFSLILVITMIDIDHMIIEPKTNRTLIALSFIYVLISKEDLKSALIGAFLIPMLLFIIHVTTNGMGMGDVKYFVGLGMVLGWQRSIVAFLVSVIVAAVLSLIFYRKVKGKKIPFGPFISIGFTVALLYGFKLIDIYLNMIL